MIETIKGSENMSETVQQNCLDIVRPFVERLDELGMLDQTQQMGGIASAALKHPGTAILPEERTIATTRDFTVDNPDLNRHREDGSLRDDDVLVLSSDQSLVGVVDKLMEEEIGDRLRRSVFGLHDADQLRHQVAHPFGLASLKTWLSDRYVERDGTMRKGLVPFAVDVPKEAMESWTLEVDGLQIPVMNPAASLASYLTRSISGFRPKDAKKVQKMAAHVHAKWPGVADWLVDGPGQSQMELAGIFHTLRRDNAWAGKHRILELGGMVRITPGSIRALAEHEAFLYRDADPQLQRAVLNQAVFKARLLGTTESHPKAVSIFQKFVEEKIGSITRNK